MKYIAKKHPKGLAIISWCIDEEYPYDEETLCNNYCLYIDVFDIEGNLVFEDGISLVQVEVSENDSLKFKRAIEESAEYHFFEAI